MRGIFRRVILCVIGFIILLSGVFIFCGRVEKRSEEALKRSIDENYIKYYTMLVDYSDRIIEGDEKVYDELNKGIKSTDLLESGTYKNALSYYYLRKNDKDNYNKYSEEAIKDYKKAEGGAPLELQTYSYMINNEIANNRYDKALRYCYEAINILNSEDSKYIRASLKDNFKVIINCNFINIFVHNDLGEEAKKYYDNIKDYKEGEEIYEDNKQFIVFSKLVYNDAIGNFEETLDLTLKYHEFAKSRGSKNLEGLRMNIGKALIRVSREDEALEHILAAKKFYNGVDNKMALASAYTVHGEYFEAKENYGKAITLYEDAYKIYEKEGAKEYQKISIEHMNRVAQKGNLDSDISKYLSQYVEIIEENNAKTGMAELFVVMEEINEKTYKSALIAKEDEKTSMEQAATEKIVFIVVLVLGIILLLITLVSLSKEIKNRKLYAKELKKIIDKDFLTNCYSRKYGINKIEELIKEDIGFSVALIDIDDFKKINDNYGHPIGDEALILIGEILNGKFKDSIIPIRYGGEEFLIIFKCEKEEAIKILEEIRVTIEQSFFAGELTLTISGGITEHRGASIEGLINLADMLLYDAKANGKNRISI